MLSKKYFALQNLSLKFKTCSPKQAIEFASLAGMHSTIRQANLMERMAILSIGKYLFEPLKEKKS